MLAFVLAAALAQPLDAEFTTAGNPRAHGIHLTIRHPSSWTARPFDTTPLGVAKIVDPSGVREVDIWLTPEIVVFPTYGGELDSPISTEEYRYIDSGQLEERLLKGGVEVRERFTFAMDGRPARWVELVTPGGGRQILVCSVVRRRGLYVVIGGIESESDYAVNRHTYAAIADSIRIHGEHEKGIGWLLAGGLIVGVLAVVALHKYVNRERVKSRR